jgi:pimeloyl-ACP methyl ester carboxylesterase
MRAFFARSRADAYASGVAAPVVVLPGIWETWKFLQPLIDELHGRGHPVHVLDVLRRNSRPVDQMAERVAAYLDEHDLHGAVIVAHSKGGLVGKEVMLGPSAARVRAMVAIATPFGGSRYARLMVVPSLRSFSPRNATILRLAAHADVNARIVSVYAAFDPHIPEGSELPGAKNVRLDTGGHFRVLAHPRVMAEVIALADTPP